METFWVIWTIVAFILLIVAICGAYHSRQVNMRSFEDKKSLIADMD